MFTNGAWTVRPVRLGEPARAVRAACLPSAPAEHFAVCHHGILVTRCASLDELAGALPFPLTDLIESR